MASVLRRILPGSSSKIEEIDDDYNVEYSFAVEYSGPPVSHDNIPNVAPIDVSRIPTASVAAKAVTLNNLSLPIIQPIVKSDRSNKKVSKELSLGKFGRTGRVHSRKPENGFHKGVLEIRKSDELGGAKDSSSSSTLEDFGDDREKSTFGSQELSREIPSFEGVEVEEDCLGESSGQGNRTSTVTFGALPSSENSDDDRKAGLDSKNSRSRSHELIREISSHEGVEVEYCVGEASGSGQGNQTSTVTFSALPSSDSNSEDSVDLDYDNKLSREISSSVELEVEYCVSEPSGLIQQGNNRTPTVTFGALPSSDAHSEQTDDLDGPEIFPEKPVVSNDGPKGLCHRCQKKNRFFSDNEICIVCGAKYCNKCVLRAMGSMPEGRKCITCIGFRIDESKRGCLGKCSRMLKKMLGDSAVKQIMSFEISCEVNQLPPHLICVNDRPLNMEELVMLQSCKNPPKKLRPGKYWYDKVSGFWGKEGEKPSQIITAQLAVGYQIRPDASNGDTDVFINNREITKPELWMLQAAGIHCEGSPHFWVTADGSYQHEGMNYVMGKLWDKKRVKIVCAALSLPFLSDTSNTGEEDVDKDTNTSNSKNLEQKTTNKILLLGCDHSGTSTIFKQAKILYDVPFSEDEKENIKCIIQRNLYRYIGILLEGHERFEEDYLIELRRQTADEPGISGDSEQDDERNIYSLSRKLKTFSNWLLQVIISGNLDAIFPAATREYSPVVEELWKDKAFQATYKRRNELQTLPRVANYFLDRAVEISRVDYEPSQMDILYAEGMTSSNGVASMEFCFPKMSQDGYMESLDQNDPLISHQLIRVHTSSLGENCKWLEMFEDVDLVIYCVSSTNYDEYHEDIKGVRTNKMIAAKKLFENIVTHPTLADKDFLLVLNKFDLLEEKIERVPLTQCEWFQGFQPVMSYYPHSVNSNNNPPLAQRAFHYMAVQFKRLFDSLTDRKLFVSRTTGLEGDSVDLALRYGREILKWNHEIRVVGTNEWSSESIDPSTDV